MTLYFAIKNTRNAKAVLDNQTYNTNYKKSFSQLSNYLKLNNAGRGSSVITLKRRLVNNGDTTTIGDYEITVYKNNPTAKDRRINKFLKSSVEREEQKDLFRDIVNDVKYFKLNKAQLLVSNKADIISYVYDQMIKLGGTDRRLFQIQFTFDRNQIGGPVEGTNQTTMVTFNEAITRAQALIDDILDTYEDDDVVIKEIGIFYKDAPRIDNLIVYGRSKGDVNNKGVKLLNNYISSRTMETLRRDSNVKKLIKFLKNHILVSPNTTDNCFFHSFYMGKFKRKNNLQNVKKLLIKYPKIKKTIKNMCDILCLEYSCKIRVIDSFNMEEKIYGDDGDTIDIFIFASHSYAVFNKDKAPEEIKNEPSLFTFSKESKIETPEYKPSKINYYIGAYDMETWNDEDNKVKPYAIGVYIKKIEKKRKRKPYKQFFMKRKKDNVIADFIKYLMGSLTPKNMKLYAHNGGRFDIWGIIEYCLLKRNFVIENMIMQNGRVINFTLCNYGSNKRIVFRDSLSFFDCSLSEACESFPSKIKKLEGDVDHRLINKNNHFINGEYVIDNKNIKQYVKKYLRYDCKSLYNCLNEYDKIINKHFNFSIYNCITNASIARRIYLSDPLGYDSEKYPLYTLDHKIDCELRPWYFGGRNEAFGKLGQEEGKFYYFDFTSLYPYCMFKNLFPYGKMTVKKVNTNDFNREWFGLVKCDVVEEDINKNIIPFHCLIKDHKLIFPRIKNKTEIICTTEEIRYSLDNNLGYKYKFKKLYLYENKANHFKPIIDKVYKLKIDAQKNNQKALRSTAKIIINSIYGFFGQKLYDKEQIEFFNNRSDDNDDKRIAEYNKFLMSKSLINARSVGKYDLYKYVGSIQSDCVSLPISMFCSSYARMELHSLMMDIKKVGGDVYYCDTDSVICNIDIHNNKYLHDKYIRSGGEKLGELTNETDKKNGYYNIKNILGCKQYCLSNNIDKDIKDELKFKGINIKSKYDNKNINEEEKIIEYTGLNNFDGKLKPTVKDFEYIGRGYKLRCDTLSFSCTDNSLLFKDEGLKKVESNKLLKKLYTKGYIDNKIIKPIII